MFVRVKVCKNFFLRFRDVKDDAGRLANERKVSVEREDFKFNFHAVSIAERVGHPLSYPKDFCDFFSHVWHDGWHGDCWGNLARDLLSPSRCKSLIIKHLRGAPA